MLGCRQLYNDSGLHLESRVIDCPTRTRTLNTKEEREKMMKGGKKQGHGTKYRWGEELLMIDELGQRYDAKKSKYWAVA